MTSRRNLLKGAIAVSAAALGGIIGAVLYPYKGATKPGMHKPSLIKPIPLYDDMDPDEPVIYRYWGRARELRIQNLIRRAHAMDPPGCFDEHLRSDAHYLPASLAYDDGCPLCRYVAAHAADMS